MKKLRQGQTVYMLNGGWEYNPPVPRIVTVFLHSQKTALPAEGYFIEKWPVNRVNNLITKYGWKNLYPSRRKALTALKRLKHYVQ